MPAMTPPPWMFSAPSSSCMLRPARVEISRNGEPRSRRWAMRWRGVSWPRFRNMGSLASEVSRTRRSSARNRSTSASMSRRLDWNVSDFGSILELRAAMRCHPRQQHVVMPGKGASPRPGTQGHELRARLATLGPGYCAACPGHRDGAQFRDDRHRITPPARPWAARRGGSPGRWASGRAAPARGGAWRWGPPRRRAGSRRR